MHANSLKPLIHLNAGEKQNKTEVCFDIYALGRDLVLVISGGETHIGAVACSNQGSLESFGLKNHKELELVKEVAHELAEATTKEILVVGGIHYDDISKEQIDEINVHIEKLTSTLKDEVAALKLDFH